MPEQAVAAFVVVAVVSSLCSTLIAAYAFRRRSVPGGLTLSITAAGTAIWAGAAAGMRIAMEPLFVRGAHLLLYVGITLTVAGIFVFVLEFTGREQHLNRKTAGLLSIEPLSVYVLFLTNPYHGWFFDSATIVGGLEAVSTVPGPAFLLHIAYSYALIAVSLAFLLQLVARSQYLYQGQAIAVIVGVAVPLAGNFAYVLGPSPVDLAPLSIAITAVFLAVAIYRYQFVQVLPIARDTVVEHLDDPVVVLDRNDRLVDLNPAGRTAFGIDPDRHVLGTPAAEVLPPGAESITADRTDDTSDELALETPEGTRHYDVRTSPLYDDRDRFTGRLVLLRDVTRQHHQQAELQRQNEQLDQFASVVSHDLRNPLNVARGYVDLLDDEERAEPIEQSLERMQTIVDDVLTLARQGQAVEDPRPVDLAAVATAGWDSVDTQGATLRTDDSVTLMADEPRLRRLFENLFRNAVEHGQSCSDGTADRDAGDARPSDVTVCVGPLRNDDATHPETDAGFYVEDDGPGIPPSERAAVLEAGVSNDDGTGLGLSIVNGIAQAHGWELTITSSEAGGARFEFRGVEMAQ